MEYGIALASNLRRVEKREAHGGSVRQCKGLNVQVPENHHHEQ